MGANAVEETPQPIESPKPSTRLYKKPSKFIPKPLISPQYPPPDYYS